MPDAGGTTPLLERLCEAGTNLEIWRVHHTAVREQDKNARVMSPEAMERLIENVRSEGRLESLPFGVHRGGFIELVSGHHRARAAVAAGITTFPMLVDTRDLTRDRVKSKQLAHNAINGTDNEAMLRQIFSEIDDVTARLEAFVVVDDKFMDGVGAGAKAINEEIAIKWPVLSFTFLPAQRERFEIIIDRLAKQVPKDCDELWLVNETAAAAFSDALGRIGRKFDIRSTGNIVGRIVELANAHLDAIEQQEKETNPGVV
jgi:hypothetical protein